MYLQDLEHIHSPLTIFKFAFLRLNLPFGEVGEAVAYCDSRIDGTVERTLLAQ